MQLNQNEMRLLQGATPSQCSPSLFRLPSLHAAIPHKAVLTAHKTSYSSFGRALVEAGVINPEALPETVATPKDVVEQGLGLWFNDRISQLKHMKFDVLILDAKSANNYIVDNSWYDVREFESFAFAIKGGFCDRRYVEQIAKSVEKKAPGLFVSVFEDLIQASWRTLAIHSPQQVLEQTTCYYLWDGDISEIPDSDKEALPGLIDRYGEEEAKHYLPSEVLKAYGEGYCFSPVRRKKRNSIRISKRKLRKLTRSPDKKLSALAKQYTAFLQARQRVVELDARMPSTAAVGAHEIWATCQILFNDDERCLEYVDQEGQNTWESGEATDLLAIEQLPIQVADLKSYFQKLDACFQLIAQMDALIPLISYPEP